MSKEAHRIPTDMTTKDPQGKQWVKPPFAMPAPI